MEAIANHCPLYCSRVPCCLALYFPIKTPAGSNN